MDKKDNRLITILTLGVLAILNTELGVIGLLPFIAQTYNIGITEAGLMVSLFALAIAISGPTMPLLFSGMNRKHAMLMVQSIFLISNIVSIFAPSFIILLIARVIPGFFHPIYVSLALSEATASVSKEEAPKAVSRIMVGVSLGMILGVSGASFIAGVLNLQFAMIFFTIITLIALSATIIYVPSMPVTKKVSYGTQLSVLRKPVVWFSVAGVILLNGSLFGVYSYIAEYLTIVTKVPATTISLILFIYSAANIVGNIIGGRLLTRNATKKILIFPFILATLYAIAFVLGHFPWPMTFIMLVWGTLSGISGIINQYWIASSAPEAPEFANGVFLTSVNLGTTTGTFVCGLFITGLGIQFVYFGGILFLALALATIVFRVRLRGNDI